MEAENILNFSSHRETLDPSSSSCERIAYPSSCERIAYPSSCERIGYPFTRRGRGRGSFSAGKKENSVKGVWFVVKPKKGLKVEIGNYQLNLKDRNLDKYVLLEMTSGNFLKLSNSGSFFENDGIKITYATQEDTNLSGDSLIFMLFLIQPIPFLEEQGRRPGGYSDIFDFLYDRGRNDFIPMLGGQDNIWFVVSNYDKLSGKGLMDLWNKAKDVGSKLTDRLSQKKDELGSKLKELSERAGTYGKKILQQLKIHIPILAKLGASVFTQYQVRRELEKMKTYLQ